MFTRAIVFCAQYTILQQSVRRDSSLSRDSLCVGGRLRSQNSNGRVQLAALFRQFTPSNLRKLTHSGTHTLRGLYTCRFRSRFSSLFPYSNIALKSPETRYHAVFRWEVSLNRYSYVKPCHGSRRRIGTDFVFASPRITQVAATAYHASERLAATKLDLWCVIIIVRIIPYAYNVINNNIVLCPCVCIRGQHGKRVVWLKTVIITARKPLDNGGWPLETAEMMWKKIPIWSCVVKAWRLLCLCTHTHTYVHRTLVLYLWSKTTDTVHCVNAIFIFVYGRF